MPLPLEEPLLTHHELLPSQQEIITTEDASVSVEDALPSLRSTTPPPPSSSPPPLSPAKGDNGGEEWREPQLNSTLNETDHNVDSCSSLDSSDAEELFNEIDQNTVHHSNLSAIVAKGMNDSLGTLSNLSEEFIVSTNLHCYSFTSCYHGRARQPTYFQNHTIACTLHPYHYPHLLTYKLSLS